MPNSSIRGRYSTLGKVKFTEDRVRKLACLKRHEMIYRETKTPGLGLRVTANGARSYIYERRVHGRTMRTTIGDVRTWQFGEARAEARRLGVLIDQGQDPRVEAQEKEAAGRARIAQERRAAVTLGDVWLPYVETQEPRWTAEYARNHVNLAAQGVRRAVWDPPVPAPLRPS